MTPAGRMSAERIASAMYGDPQFRPPRLPRLVDGLVIVTSPEGVLIEGGAERQHLRGAASVSLLPGLLAALDGRRDVAALAAQLGEPPARVGKAVALLYACGLLEEGADGDLPDDANPQVAAFLSRHVDTTRANANTAGALRRLADAVVVVVGPPDDAGALVDALREAGVGSVEHVDALSSEPAARSVTLAVGLESRDGSDALTRLDRDCAVAAVPWVRFALCDDAIEIGPRFERSVSLCYDCFAALHGRPARAPGADPIASNLFLAHAAAEVTWLVARICSTLSPGGLTRIALENLTQERRAYPGRPGCETCTTAVPPPMPGVSVAYAYDRSVAFPPRHLLNVKDHQHHFRESNLALQSDAKNYPNAARIDLPGPEEELPPGGVFEAGVSQPAAGPGRLDLRSLAALLARAAGVRGDRQGPPALPGKLSRWAPSGGNLGSVGIYVLVRELDGLTAGVWFYAPQTRQLLALSPRRDADAVAALRRASGAALDPATQVTLVFTGALMRVAQKYGTFAYRTVHLDAGCALAQLHATSPGLGLALQSASTWDDDALLDALGLNEFEPVTAIIGIRPAAIGGLVATGEVDWRAAEAESASGLLAASDYEPTRIYRELLRRSRLPAARAEGQADAEHPAWLMTGSQTTLEPAAGWSEVEAVLRRRRSVRIYDPRPLDADTLATALRAAWHAPLDSGSRAAIEIAVLSRRVEGLDPGLWSLEGADPVSLTRRNDLPLAAAAEDIVLQREYGHAPALILVLGSLRMSDVRAGAHGYRLLLRAATAAAHAAWLGALSAGADGSIFAGLLPDAVDGLCGGGPYDRAQLIGLALGYAPAQSR